MSLPIRTTLDDIAAVCSYLSTKPTGATLHEARAIVDKKFLDGRKLNALKFWGFIEEAGTKMRITDLGRQAVKNGGALRSEALREVVRGVTPYAAVVERAAHRQDKSVAAIDGIGKTTWLPIGTTILRGLSLTPTKSSTTKPSVFFRLRRELT